MIIEMHTLEKRQKELNNKKQENKWLERKHFDC